MTTKHDTDDLKRRANRLRLYGLLSRWDELCTKAWVAELVALEEVERRRRSHQYRIRAANIGDFKPLVDFDWKHPTKVDRKQIETLFGLGFLDDHENVVIVGPNGLGKSMIAQNLAHQAVLRGISVRYVATSDMLNDLAAVDGSARKHRIKRYVNPKLLAIDEVGYLSYDTRHADLLYEVVRQRYEAKRSIVLTTNKAFAEWNQVFDSAACVVTLVDRLCHRADIVELDGESYRKKEAELRAKLRRDQRRTAKSR